MRLFLLSTLLTLCAGSREVRPTPEQPIDAPRLEPAALEVKTAPCPLTVPLKGEPACRFEPIEASGPALQRAARFTCTLAGTPEPVPSNRTPAVALTVSVVEGNTSFGLRYLVDVAGRVYVPPDTVSQPALLDGTLVGITALGGEAVFWRDGTCEAISGGPLLALAPLRDGELVVLQKTVESDHRVLMRSREGAWSTLGLLPRGVEPWLSSESGRVAVLATRLYPAEWEALLPDFGRTLVLRRTEEPSFDRPRGSAALTPVPGSRFSSAATLHTVAGKWYVRRPGAPRVPLPIPDAHPCRTPQGREKPEPAPYLNPLAPAVTALGGRDVLVTWVEERGSCKHTLVTYPQRTCAPGEPCQPTPPPHWDVEAESLGAEVVVARIGADVDELARVKLPRPLRKQWVFGSSLAATEQQLVVHAWGHVLQLDRRALEAR